MSLQEKIDIKITELAKADSILEIAEIRKEIKDLIDAHDCDRCYVRCSMRAGPIKMEVYYFKDLVTGEPGANNVRYYFGDQLQGEFGEQQVKLMAKMFDLANGNEIVGIPDDAVVETFDGEGAPLAVSEENA